jgi:formate dehydrogenase gamma subunit
MERAPWRDPKGRTKRAAALGLGIFIAIATGISGEETKVPEAIPNKQCMECHSDPDLTMEKEDGTEVSIFVDEEKLKQHIHRDVTCWECHRDLTEEHPDSEEPVKPVDCARCHKEESRTFGTSAHGQALLRGMDAAASCKDCHGSHDILSPLTPGSPLHFSKQAETCGKCHEDAAADVAASVHGRATLKGVREAPSCTDCHEEHRLHSLAGSAASREVGDTCSRCHESERINTKFGMPTDRVQTFFESYHGLALKGGAANAANCASCHGYHKILPSTDPLSTVHKANLVDTCGKCHPGAGENFTQGEIHLRNVGNGSIGSVVNHWVRLGYLALIFVVIGAMLGHNFLSWMRALKAWRGARGETVVRMNLHQRMQHFVLVLSFVILAVSGFALKFPESWLAWVFGSNEEIRRWVHRVAGVVMLAGGLWHIVYLAGTRDGRKLVADFMFRMQDVRDIFSNLLYFVGKKPHHPRFARFGYVEKLEYWAVVWGTVIMGVTGLMIWFKVDVTGYFPRWVVDVAITIHYYEAILACLAILVWHMYHVLFAPGTYPMNFAWWDGKVSKEWLEDEHPLDPALQEPAEEGVTETAMEPPVDTDARG